MSHDPFVYTAVQYENALAQCAALVARVVAAETALAATRAENEQLQAIADDFRAFLASLNEDADVPDQPNPDGDGLPKTDGHVDPNGEPNPSIIGEPELHEACDTRHYWAITPCPVSGQPEP